MLNTKKNKQHSKFIKLFIPLILILSCILWISCEDDHLTVPDEANALIESDNYKFGDRKCLMPNVRAKVVDGRLTFSTLEDMRLYYKGLEERVNESDSPDEVMACFEKGYNSLRPVIEKDENEFYSRNAFRRTNEQFSRGFIKDDIRKSILNEYYEVGVGSDVYIFMAQGQVLKTSCVSEVMKVRQLEKGLEGKIHPELFYSSGTLFSNNKIIYQGTLEQHCGNTDTGGGGTGNDDDALAECETYNSNANTSGDSCDPFIANLQLLNEAVPYDCDSGESFPEQSYRKNSLFEINWGDGSAVQTINDLDPLVTHLYSGSAGTSFTITITGSAVDDGGNIHPLTIPDQTFTISTSSTCVGREASKTIWTYPLVTGTAPVGLRGMKCEVWYKDDILGTHVGSKTTGKRWNGSMWETESGEIDVEIHLTWTDSDCTNPDPAFDDADCNNCNYKSCKETKDFQRNHRVDNNTVPIVSIHKFKDNGVTLDKQIILDFCTD